MKLESMLESIVEGLQLVKRGIENEIGKCNDENEIGKCNDENENSASKADNSMLSSIPMLNSQVGSHVIVRTYSSGVHFGLLSEKAGNEVYLLNSRRLFRFMCPKSISLSDVAINGIDQSRSKICEEVSRTWLPAIEILDVTQKCIDSIKSSPIAEQD